MKKLFQMVARQSYLFRLVITKLFRLSPKQRYEVFGLVGAEDVILEILDKK